MNPDQVDQYTILSPIGNRIDASPGEEYISRMTIAMQTHTELVIFTDLDGTLLDASYSFDAAAEALGVIDDLEIPLVLCSSKTRGEIEVWRARLGNHHPFISENGGGIFVPMGYFPADSFFNEYSPELEGEYLVIRLGTPYRRLRRAIRELRAEGFAVTGFGDMSSEEIAARTGLLPSDALLAGERDFDEPFLFHGNDDELGKLFASVRSKGFSITSGAFFHLMGNSDKGKAVTILAGIYRKQRGRITTISLGNHPNDVPMLEQADYRVLVADSRGNHDPSIQLPGLIREQGTGPAGWNRAVIELLKRLRE